MKYTNILSYLLVILLLVTVLTGCADSSSQPEDPLADYVEMLNGDIPEDLRLTIYYMDPRILTLRALSAEDLISFPETKKIVIESDELLANFEVFKKLDPSELVPAIVTSYINARMYYVLEAGESGKLLEVTISEIRGNVVVNGMEVEFDPVFYELIEPFWTEEARIMYDWRKET